MMSVYIGCTLLSVVTCEFPLSKLGYFAGTGGFHVAVADGSVLSRLGGFNFDMLWPVPWLCSSFIRYYRNAVGFPVLFTDFVVGE
jgi:hypothetical protein